jgi:hypothetical protein
VPRGGDASAHLYRTFLVQHGALLWDNLWFAGQYPLVSYSLLYYFPAAVLGNGALGAAAVVASALLFTSIVTRVWADAARLPAYGFALVAGGQFFTGDYPYTLGFAALLATIWALQGARTRLAIAFAALTLGCSPLAFLFLCLALFALSLVSATPRSRKVTVASALAALAAVELGALSLFPSGGLYYPFAGWRIVLGLPVGLLGAAVALRSRSARPLACIFIVWTVTTLAGYFIPSPVGHNLLRPATMVFPLMLLAATLADFTPRWLALPAVAAALAANFGPYVTTVISRADEASSPSFWAPMLSYVAHHTSPDFRLEVVPTVNHWEAYYVPRSGFPIARGWYQQLDNGDNPAFFSRSLTPERYRAWLRSVGVRFVLVAHTAPASGAVPEEHLLTSGRSGLRKVFASTSGTVYELRHPTPILTGPATAAITQLTHETITGWARRRGAYLLRVHYTPFWSLARGRLCLLRGAHDMTELWLDRAGTFSLHASESPRALLDIVLDHDHADALVCHTRLPRSPAVRP